MPDREGLETIQQLRQSGSDTKIIAMSGGGSIKPEEYLEMAERVGADRTVEKPLDRQALLTAVAELIGHPQSTAVE